MESLEPTRTGLQRAAQLLREGCVVGIPTDTVYGLVALAGNRLAIGRIYEIKSRPPERALPLLVSSAEEAATWVVVDERARGYMERWWPGPLTLVLPARTRRSSAPTLAVRAPNHPVALGLLARVGALASSSANLSGEPPALSAEAVRVLSGVAAVIDAGQAPGGLASTLLDLSREPPAILRSGPLRDSDLV